jgi:oxaloacetate decarboxylase alpha subunit
MIPWETLHEAGQILADGELTELVWENDDFKINMTITGTATAAMPAESATRTATTGALPRAADEVPSDWIGVESPMVGTFYEAPSPDAEPFVAVGDRVGSDSTVCIIEAMKLMNEIEADCKGTVKQICKEDAESVSKGEVLFYIEPD